jgi:hypothetical protein
MRKLLILTLLSSFAVPLFAQDATKFLIERIDVRNLHHVSPEIVRSETRLATGRAYSEDDLRQASDRVSRLPFILDAQFSLEKGSVRDSYVLVINVTETRRFFYLFDWTTLVGPNRNLGGVTDNGLAIGLRTFVGRSGALHLALGAAEEFISRSTTGRLDLLQAGYTRYNLFGTNAFATFSLGVPIDQFNRARHPLPELVVGVPLSGTQTLTVIASTSDIHNSLHVFEHPELADARYQRRAVRFTWSHNTTDHPFFPTRGTLISVGPLLAWDDDDILLTYQPAPGVPYQTILTPEHTHTWGLTFDVARYVPLSDRNTIWARSYGDLRRIHGTRIDQHYGVNAEPHTEVAIVGYSHSFFSAEERAKDGDSRLETSLRYQREPAQLPSRSTSSLNVAYVRRHAWGTLRAGVGFAW